VDGERAGISVVGAVEVDIDLYRGVGENVLRFGVDVFDEDLRDDAESDLAVDAAEGEVVDFVAEGWDVFAFGGIDVEREDVVLWLEVMGELEAEGCVAAAILAELVAVAVDGGGEHDAFEVGEDALALRGGGDVELAAIGGDELEVAVVEAVPR